MGKVFEDYFSELQADMISICLEYVEKRADIIYVYCSFEEMTVSCDFFYCINDNIVRKHKLNDVISDKSFRYDTSAARQTAVMDIIIEDIEGIYKLCNEYQKEMPTEIKLIYDVNKNSLKADYKYELVYSKDEQKTADDIAMEWYEEVKNSSYL